MSPAAKLPSTEIGGLKAKALHSAARLLAERGAEDLSLRAIAEDAGIGLASIYHYFASKEDLLLSLAIAGFDELRRDILKQQSDPQVPTPMQGGARAYFAFAQSKPALFSLMFSERLLARHEALRAAEHQAFLAYETAVKADKRFPPEQKQNVALTLWALGRGIAAIVSSSPGDAPWEKEFERLLAGAAFLLNRPDLKAPD